MKGKTVFEEKFLKVALGLGSRGERKMSNKNPLIVTGFFLFYAFFLCSHGHFLVVTSNLVSQFVTDILYSRRENLAIFITVAFTKTRTLFPILALAI